MRSGETAQRTGVLRQAIYVVIQPVPVPADTPETAAVPAKKERYKRIRLGRIRKAKARIGQAKRGSPGGKSLSFAHGSDCTDITA
jgi:hypothetical protein